MSASWIVWSEQCLGWDNHSQPGNPVDTKSYDLSLFELTHFKSTLQVDYLVGHLVGHLSGTFYDSLLVTT